MQKTQDGDPKSVPKSTKKLSKLQWLLSNKTLPDSTLHFFPCQAKCSKTKTKQKNLQASLKNKRKKSKGISVSSSYLQSSSPVTTLSLSHQLDYPASFKNNFSAKNAQSTGGELSTHSRIFPFRK